MFSMFCVRIISFDLSVLGVPFPVVKGGLHGRQAKVIFERLTSSALLNLLSRKAWRLPVKFMRSCFCWQSRQLEAELPRLHIMLLHAFQKEDARTGSKCCSSSWFCPLLCVQVLMLKVRLVQAECRPHSRASQFTTPFICELRAERRCMHWPTHL